MREFAKRQWLTVLLILALFVSTYVALQQGNRAQEAAETVRLKAIETCADTSGSAALVVAFKEEVALRARRRGENEAYEVFKALARGGEDLIPLPADAQGFRPHLSDVRREGDKFVLSPEARKLIVRGCVEAYDPDDFNVRLDK